MEEKFIKSFETPKLPNKRIFVFAAIIVSLLTCSAFFFLLSLKNVKIANETIRLQLVKTAELTDTRLHELEHKSRLSLIDSEEFRQRLDFVVNESLKTQEIVNRELANRQLVAKKPILKLKKKNSKSSRL